MFSFVLFPLLFVPAVLYKAFFVPEPIPCTYYKVVRAASGKSAVVVSHDMSCTTFFQNYTVRFIRHMARYLVDYESYVLFDYDDIANTITCRIHATDLEEVQRALQADANLLCEHEEYLDYTDEDDKFENGSNISEDDSVELDSFSDELTVSPCQKSVLSTMHSNHMGSVHGAAYDTIFEAIYAVKNKAALLKRKGFPPHVKHFYMAKMRCEKISNLSDLLESEHALRYIRKARICLKSETDKSLPYPYDTSGIPYDTILYTEDGKWFAVFGTGDGGEPNLNVKNEQDGNRNEGEIVLVHEDDEHGEIETISENKSD